jgi:glycerol kinase
MDVLKAMEADAGTPINELRVDGGATANNLLMQFQADVMKCRVIRPKVTEVTALGAAYLAGLATGFWSGVDEISEQWQVERNFEPEDIENYDDLVDGWNRAVRAAKANVNHLK